MSVTEATPLTMQTFSLVFFQQVLVYFSRALRNIDVGVYGHGPTVGGCLEWPLEEVQMFH